MANGYAYPKEIDGAEFPPFIIGRLEYFRPEQNGKVGNGCRMAICKELPDAETHIYRQWSYEGETEPRKWHSYGTVPKYWTVAQVLTMAQLETKDWQLRKKPWDTEAKLEKAEAPKKRPAKQKPEKVGQTIAKFAPKKKRMLDAIEQDREPF